MTLLSVLGRYSATRVRNGTGLCGRCPGVAVPLRVVPSATGLPSKRAPGLGSFSRADRGIGGWGCGGKPSFPSPSAGDLRELPGVPLRGEGSCGGTPTQPPTHTLGCTLHPRNTTWACHRHATHGDLRELPGVPLRGEGSCGGGVAPRDSAGSGATEEGLTSRGGRKLRLPLWLS